MAERHTYFEDTISLLSQLISIESFSKQEDKTADLLKKYLSGKGVKARRKGNNVWCTNKHFDPSKKSILLNSHHDTVKPNQGYTKDPFRPEITDEKLYGLGSNDAGGCLVGLLHTFLHFQEQPDLKYNLIYAATAEEENSGKGGVQSIVADLPEIVFGIVGEPTEMKLAVAEKGLMVLDCKSKGVAGHAARDTGTNAIYLALKDIEWLKNYQFPNISEFLGPIKLTTTLIQAGTQHNVVPDECTFVVDVRTTDAYTNEETLQIIKESLNAEVTARSTRLRPSAIGPDHMVRVTGDKLGIEQVGSPTTSDQAVIPYDTVKFGPGKSERSHTADEFIFLDDIDDGLTGYIEFLDEIFRQ